MSMFDLIYSIAQVTPVTPVDPASVPFTPINWNTIILAVLSLLGTAVSGVIAVFVAKANANAKTAAIAADDAALKVDEVKEDLRENTVASAQSMADLKKVTKDVHTLVNANMGAQLKISALALRRVADLTKHQDDVAAAELAEQLLTAHNEKQAVVDKRNETD